MAGQQLPFAELVATTTPQEVWMDALHQCENPDNIPKILDVNGKYSYGKYEWQMFSWLKYKKQGATKQNILDEEMQDKITKYVLDTKGDDDWWTCGNLVSSKIGSYHSQ